MTPISISLVILLIESPTSQGFNGIYIEIGGIIARFIDKSWGFA
jgi:hypothetical protein